MIDFLFRRIIGRKKRLLCFLNHYYNPNGPFKGKSATQRPEVRRLIVCRAIEQLRTSRFDIEIKVCGISEWGLINIDIPFTTLADPRHLIYASIERMVSQLESFDYFLNLEDDIYVPRETLVNAMDFDESEGCNELLHPNRMEIYQESKYCVDLRAMPGWTTMRRNYKGRHLAVAINPNSAFMLLSREKFAYAVRMVDLSFRGIIIGDFMASAYCNVHAPFTLWRSFNDLNFHFVEHLDRWEPL
jgi:hypothetical protein